MKRKQLIVILILIIAAFIFSSCDDALSSIIRPGQLEGTKWIYQYNWGTPGQVTEIFLFSSSSSGTVININIPGNTTSESITYTYSSSLGRGEITYKNQGTELFELSYSYLYGEYVLIVNPGLSGREFRRFKNQ